MRLLPLLLLVLAAVPPALAQERREIGNLVLDGVPEIPKDVARRMSQYQNVRGAQLVDWAPGGDGVYVTTRFGDTAQIHQVRSPGAWREQLTFEDEPVRGAAIDPKRLDGDGVLFVTDAGGGEFFQFLRLDRGSGRVRLFTDGKSRNESPLFAPEGGRVAFVSTRRNGTDFDLYVQGSEPGAPARLVKELAGQWMPLDWSPDGKRLLLQRYVSINESYLHLVDVESGAMTELNARPGERISYAAAAFATNGAVVWTCDEGSEFLRLTRFELEKGTSELLAPQLAWDVSAVEVSADGKWLAYAANEGGTTGLYLAPLASPRKAVRVALPKGVVGRFRFDPASTRLALTFNGAAATDDVYTVDLKSRRITRWTFSEVGGLNPSRFVTPELVEYPSFDGRRIPAWLFKPAESKGKLPVVINIHGGPEGQSLAWFNPFAQYLVNELGIAVLYPNVRGSSGYGKSYLLLDNGTARMDSVKDIGALLDWIGAQPGLDSARVGVIGGSYGGFMALASMAEYDARLKCGVDVVGISHFVTFLEKTEGYRRDLRRAEYGDERDPAMRAFLEGISPLTNAKKITRPLFVVQGLNDPRVPAGEAEQIVRTVRKNGRTVWYLLAKDEGHGFAKKRNRDLYLNATSLFFERFLLH